MLAVALISIFIVAPREISMGDLQRIVYLHVSVAWCGLAGCLAMGCSGGIYLLHRNLRWDHWAQASGEVGWLCTTLTLVTGSLWAHEAWNTWWTWEPRLTAALILWALYGACFLTRMSIEDPHTRARVSSLLAILALLDLPMVIMATRWFRGMHPVSPEMDPQMRVVLLISVLSFTVFFCVLTIYRRSQLSLFERAAWLQPSIVHET
jgi:heme exporter protein C